MWCSTFLVSVAQWRTDKYESEAYNFQSDPQMMEPITIGII